MWGQVEVATDAHSTLHFGALAVCLRHTRDEWRLAYSYQESEDPDFSPEEVKWIRFITTADELLELTPVLPDRPLVIRPESPVSIFPGRLASFFVALPVWYRFVAVSKQKRTDLIDIPSRVLSNTWFGDPSAGELCYSLDAPLRRAPERLDDRARAVTCQLTVRNGSEEKLNFERICVHVENLSIFEADGFLWANEINVLFKGVEQASQITIKERAPGNLSNARKLTSPREAVNRNILRRSFIFFRQFTGI